MKLILISGLSGSGKSVALNLLEDAGYYCVDNLPVAMLTVLARMMDEEGVQKVAVAIDARSGHGIDLVPQKLETLKKAGIEPIFLFCFRTKKPCSSAIPNPAVGIRWPPRVRHCLRRFVRKICCLNPFPPSVTASTPAA